MSALSVAVAPPAGPALRDIHLPPAPSWWPPAPGWWGLMALVLLATAAVLWWWRRRRRLRRRVAGALAEIDALAARHAVDGDDGALAAGLHQLLRRAARRHEATAAHVAGAAWHSVLERVPTDAATVAALIALEQAIYRPAQLDRSAALSATRRWVAAALRQRADGVAHA